MLNLYKSNKIEVISELLAEELKICPPPINEKLEIVVPNYFLGNWLREQITIKNKISALYELKTISTYTESLLTNFFPAIDMSAWNYESIKWGIIDSLEELNSFIESFPIRNWINKYLDNKKTIDGDIYNLTKKITNNFIDYLIFRPEMIAEWNRYEINSGVVTFLPIHSIVVVTSPIGDHAPPALAAIIIIAAYHNLKFLFDTTFCNIEISTIVAVRLSMIADKINAKPEKTHKIPFLVLRLIIF